MNKFQKLRLGEIRPMACGLSAMIIKYEDTWHIRVRFSDGAEVDTSYRQFKRGRLKHPGMKVNLPKSERVGEKRRMNCGLMAELVRYRNEADIDVIFKNGILVQHKRYRKFLEGGIGCPGHEKKDRLARERLGEKRRMNCGEEAEITAYYSNKNLSLRFSDGTIREHVSYENFKKGRVKKDRHAGPPIKDRTGEKVTTADGKTLVIVRYESVNDIDVRFPDGAIAKHVLYEKFKHGEVRYPGASLSTGKTRLAKEKYEGKTFLTPHGPAVITAYRRWEDVDIRYSDGTTKEHVSLRALKDYDSRHENRPLY